MGERKKLFIAMPFKDEHDPIFETVQHVARNLDLELVHIGKSIFTGSIIDRIRTEIEEADVMIAIATEENGNVYYEIGLAHCQRKPVLLLTSNPEKTKFDLRDHRAVVYDPKKPAAVIDDITRIINSALNARKDPQSFLESAYGTTIEQVGRQGFCPVPQAVARIAKETTLQDPVQVLGYELLPTGDLAMTVKDFFGEVVRAVIDVNGIIVRLKRFAGHGSDQ